MIILDNENIDVFKNPSIVIIAVHIVNKLTFVDVDPNFIYVSMSIYTSVLYTY
jgi:hypothetical protein